MSPRSSSGARAATPIARAPRPRWLALTALFIALFFAVASNTMVLTGLPQIIGDLDGTPVQYTWIVTTSLLVLAITTPVWGRLSARYSATKLLIVALVFYVVGAVGAGSALEPWTIVGCRALIGIGAGGIVTLVQFIVTELTTERERPAYFGILGSITSVAAILAPALGGVIVDIGGWRWVFYCTAPVALLALVMLWRFAPDITPSGTSGGRFDAAGTIVIAAAATSIMIAFSVLETSIPIALAITAGAIVLIVAAVFIERRAASPLIPGLLLRNRELVLVLVASGVGGVAAFGTSVYIAMYLQDVRGATAGESGMLLIPLSVATLVASLFVGYIVTRTQRDKLMLLIGMTALCIGYAALVFVGHDTPLWYVVVSGSVVSLGVGAVTQQVVATGQRFLRREDLPVGSALILFSRSLMTVLCLSGFGAALAFVASTASAADAVLAGVRVVFLACLVVGLIGATVILALPSTRAARMPGNAADTSRDENEMAL